MAVCVVLVAKLIDAMPDVALVLRQFHRTCTFTKVSCTTHLSPVRPVSVGRTTVSASRVASRARPQNALDSSSSDVRALSPAAPRSHSGANNRRSLGKIGELGGGVKSVVGSNIQSIDNQPGTGPKRIARFSEPFHSIVRTTAKILTKSVAFEPMSRREVIYRARDDVEVVRKTSTKDYTVRDLRWHQRNGSNFWLHCHLSPG